MKTLLHKLTHDKLFTTVLFAIFIFFAITATTSFFKNRSMHYFGTISQLSEKQLVISDKKFGERTFFLTSSTNIRLGAKSTQKLQVGQDVFVVAKGVEQDRAEALEIRIFDLKK